MTDVLFPVKTNKITLVSAC